MKWLAISTSSPIASVAILEDAELIASRRQNAVMRASAAVMQILEELGADGVQIFACDVGPGSFTGIKVGLMITKTLAFARGANCAGLSAFDLISPTGPVAIPSRKGRYLVRSSDRQVSELEANTLGDISAVGYGDVFVHQAVPRAENAAALFQLLVRVSPHELAAQYFLEPNISAPKTPYKQ